MSHKPVEAVRLHARDHVAVAARPLKRGVEVSVDGVSVTPLDEIPPGHKVALRDVAEGEAILKFGHPIGVATAFIPAGVHVHTHNVRAELPSRSFAAASDIPPDPEPLTGRTFEGYRCAGGKAGTRNYVAIISTVNCSASVSKYVARRFDDSILRDYPNIDGILPLTHHGGCAVQFGGMQHEMLNRVLAGMARHPNVGAYLLIGLGCEQGTMGYLVGSQRLVQIDGVAGSGEPPTLSIQDCGGTQQTVERAVQMLADLLPRANDVRRETIPASELVLATECGGSDGNSGITANPALGVAADLLVAAGGTAILSETTEIAGAEQLLTRRARTPDVAEKLLARIRWWENYAAALNSELNNNPSAGNKAGGLTTIYEKSLGAVAKAGSTALEAVYEYAEPVEAKGLVVMDSPGFDPVSVTGMVAGGANLVAFTTGRGSCFGCKPVPSLKITTNTRLFERMPDDMDLDAGRILTGTPVDEVGREIFDELLAVASGKKTKSEEHGIGEEEFSPWIVGPVL